MHQSVFRAAIRQTFILIGRLANRCSQFDCVTVVFTMAVNLIPLTLTRRRNVLQRRMSTNDWCKNNA